MKIALIGATGFVGAAVLAELLARGHDVTALVRNPARLPAHPQVRAVPGDVADSAHVAAAVAGHDAVVSAFNPGWEAPGLYDLFMQGSAAIVRGVEAAGVRRLLVVGGAGSLFVAPGVQLVDTPGFIEQVPANIVRGAQAARDFLATLRANSTLDWTFLSPPAFLDPGTRGSGYRVGTDALLMDGAQPARITVGELAVALVDEIETPRHRKARFTVAA
jgi:putative NADH-flavin reductase